MSDYRKFPGAAFKTASLAVASLRAGLDLPKAQKRLRLLAYAQPLILAIITYLVASRFAAIGVDALHDGIMFKPALDVAEGKMLFRDTYQQYGAFTTLLQALALKLFGPYLLVIRLQTAFSYALIGCFLWLIWKRFNPQWLATVCGIIFICMAPYFLNIFFINHSPNYGWWFQPWSSVFSLFFQLLSLYLLILYVEKRAWPYLAATGAAVALTMWSRQPVGALLFCAVSFFIACLAIFERSAWKKFLGHAALFISGFVVINAVFIVWLLLNHALKDMWLQSVVSVSAWARQRGADLTLPALFAAFFPPPGKFNSFPTYVWAALPIPCLILFFRTFVNYLWKRQLDTKQLVVFAAVLVCLASWAQYYPVLCERHVYWAAAPMFGVFAYFVWDLLKHENAFYRGVITLFALVLLFQGDIACRIRGGRARLHQEYITLSRPKILKGMKIPPHDALFFQTVAADIDNYFKRYPAGGLINRSMDALYPAFVENLVNFHPIYIQAYWLAETLYSDYAAKLAKYARERKPIIISHTDPVIYDGYTIKSVGRDMYVTAPGEPKSAWYITAFRSVPRGPEESPAAPRDYSLDLTYGKKNTTTVRLLGVIASDFNGVLQGAWQPVAQTTCSMVLSYMSAPSAGTLRPISPELIIPSEKKIQVRLTGHNFPHYSTALKMTVVVATGDNIRFKQTVSFLPLFGPTPEDLINLCLQRYLAGDFHGAIQAAAGALRLRPDFALAYNNICAAWNSLGEWDKAVKAGERAVALDPANVLARNNLALARSRAAAGR